MDAIISGLIIYAILVGSLTVHEWAHAYSAWKLGDPTAKQLGRVSFNPLVHIDLIGTVILPLFMIFVGGIALFGWAKPVPVNSRNFRNRDRDDLIVTAAGPLSNVGIFLILGLLSLPLLGLVPALHGIVVYAIAINFILAIFNMIPIPPLDGSHFLRVGLGISHETFLKLSMVGPIALLVLINIPQVRMLLGSMVHAALGFFPWLSA